MGRFSKQEFAGTIHWERLKCQGALDESHHVFRARVEGGWLVQVAMGLGSGLTFVPDPEHAWVPDPTEDR